VGTEPSTYRDFLAVRYWPQLDGLRVVSILIVLVAHMDDRWVPQFKGALGVVVFFVISGFLITSLLIREERRLGRVSLRSFYVKRFFRIVPLYMLALATATALVLVGFGDPVATFLRRLPLLATFNGDLAGGGTFVASWSVGVEEKFYILWPLLAFAFVPLMRRRGLIATVLLIACLAAAFLPPAVYMGTYVGISAGCLLAVCMHTERGYAIARILAGPRVGALLLALAAVAFVIDIWLPWTDSTGYAHPLFAITVALAFPGLLIGNSWQQKALSWRPLAVAGTRTYGVYLFHPFCIDVISRVIPEGQTSPITGGVRLTLAVLLSWAVAEAVHRLFERPLIAVGRRVAKSGPPLGTVDSVSALPGKR
jgi:peptidoglycan/LPS O-acetylase OafA/YrhL